MPIDTLIQYLEIPNSYFCKKMKNQKETDAFIKEPYQVIEVLEKLLQYNRNKPIVLRYGLNGGSLRQNIIITDFERHDKELYINGKTYIINIEPTYFTNFTGQLYIRSEGVSLNYSKRLPFGGDREEFTFIFPLQRSGSGTGNNIISKKEEEKWI